MGFENVRKNDGEKLPSKKASEMKDGEELIGYAVRVDEFEGKYGPSRSLILRDKDTNEDTRIYACGDLDYDLKDGRVKVGYLTKIKCKGKDQRKAKNGANYTITAFETAQDPEDVIEELVPQVNTEAKAIQDRVEALRNKQV